MHSTIEAKVYSPINTLSMQAAMMLLQQSMITTQHANVSCWHHP